MKRSSHRVGFTLVELLVVIAIIGLLVALLLPAVQAAREAGRQAECKNHQKQIVTALHLHHDVHKLLPVGSMGQVPPIQYFENARTTWMVSLLPFIEQNNLYQRYDPLVGFGPPNSPAVNGAVFGTAIKVYRCPSDSAGVVDIHGHNDVGTRSNYVGCYSPGAGYVANDAPQVMNFNKDPGAGYSSENRRALFNFNRKRSLAHVTDGASNTIAVSEIIAGSDTTGDLRGIWWADLGDGYTHFTTPNSPTPDNTVNYHCPGAVVPTRWSPFICTQNGWQLTDIAARSFHPGGVLAARADGSVSFVSNTIDLSAWQALGSINGGEAVQ